MKLPYYIIAGLLIAILGCRPIIINCNCPKKDTVYIQIPYEYPYDKGFYKWAEQKPFIYDTARFFFRTVPGYQTDSILRIKPGYFKLNPNITLL